MYTLSTQIPAHNGEVRCGAKIGKNKFISGGFDACCVSWSLEDGRLIKEREIYGNSDFVYTICPHPSNPNWFVTGSKDRKIFVFDSLTGDKIVEMHAASEIHSGPICSLTVAGDELIVAGSWDGTFSTWTSQGEFVSRNASAGSHAVAVAFSQSTSTIITGSQDKALRWWSLETGDLVREIPNAHEDIIRSISVKDQLVLTTSNDCTIKLWSVTTGECLYTTLGHSNFIFNVSFGIEGLFFSASEDKTAKSWTIDDNCHVANTQSFPHPGTVWFAHQLDNQTFVTGCSDGIVRSFSSNPARHAPAEELEAYSSLCASAAASESQEQIDPSTVPSESDMNRYRGKKIGEIKMFKNETNEVFAYQWTQVGNWEKVGLVTGGNQTAKKGQKKFYAGDQYFAQGEYDYVFDVELGESGRMALLPINESDNPLVCAEQFCARESINKSNLSQIIDFIKTNTTAGGRKIGGDVETTSGVSSHFPLLNPFLFKEAKWPQLIAKLNSVNVSLTPIEMARIDRIAATLDTRKPLSEFTSTDVAIIFSKLNSTIPLDSLFVVFDLWRLVVLDPSVASELFRNADGGSAYILHAARQMTANIGNNTGMCCARFITNIFASSVSKWAIMDRADLVVDALVSGCSEPASKLTQLASASALANMASATSEKKTNPKLIAIAETLFDRISRLISPTCDPDVLYRLVVGLGCLSLVNGDIRSRVVQLCASLSSLPPIVQPVISDILSL